jgi:hypothetical protein
MEISLKDYQGYSGKLFIYEEMTDFVRAVENKFGNRDDIKFSVGLVPAGYYLSDEGCYGYVGCTGKTSCNEETSSNDETKSKFGKETETLNLSFEVDDSWLTVNEDKLKMLVATPGGRPTAYFDTYFHRKVTNYCQVEKQYGLYKNACFDDVFKVMKEHGLVDDPLELVYYKSDHFNKDFVYKKEYTNDENCLKKWSKNVYLSEPRGKIIVHIKIITTDLKRNTDALLDILSAV